ncbi:MULTISPECIES: hypothetical protein [unclassified Streptomyces]|uniref:hypothetical protein n=1 Tax=unclassified Streptomyces TaxID=2593676 RepID=UPI001319E66E|nr:MULTISPECIES: hypothetical protein [unclassified Streptomyces]
MARALVTRDRPPTPVRLAEPHGTDPDETREGHQAAGRSARVRDETWEDYVLGTDRTTCTCGCGCDFGVRLLAVRKHAYGYDYAWCFPRDPEAVESAVAAWNPEMQDESLGWHKRPMNPPTAAGCVLAPSGLAVGRLLGAAPNAFLDAAGTLVTVADEVLSRGVRQLFEHGRGQVHGLSCTMRVGATLGQRPASTAPSH